MGRVADGDLPGDELRRVSLLGSTTMLRVLAGVYHDLLAAGWQSEEVADFFGKLDPQMDVPLRADSPWVTDVPGEIFSKERRARRPDVRIPCSQGRDRRLGSDAPAWLVAEPA